MSNARMVHQQRPVILRPCRSRISVPANPITFHIGNYMKQLVAGHL
ncbi:hypothetical protein KC19_8G037700 [Ceratodon purpureus]|uniref:Uncharacterized protein n=1 Tax=Ceratodon purpureus TaxID=3225 RepID=A0A8T0GYI7_CERPU|nr:hypothetical protein KC19_8G037700 [Ceratodon purpureus]